MKIKYMGSADVRHIAAGEDFGGRLAEPIAREVVWDRHNGFVVNTDELGLSSGAADLLLKDPEFLDVTSHDVYPLSDGDKKFRGLSDEPRTSKLPPGYTSVGAIPTSQGSSDAPEAVAFAQAVAGTPTSPVVTTSTPKAPAPRTVTTEDS